MSKSFVRDANGRMVDLADVTLPTNRTFRSAWVHDVKGAAIVVDLGHAKDQFRIAAHEAAKRVWLEETLPAYIDAEMSDDNSEKARLKGKRGKSKGSAEVDLSSATTVEDLVALWDEDSLGPNPFAA